MARSSYIQARVAERLGEAQHWARHNCNASNLNATMQKHNIDPQTLLYGTLALLTLAWIVSRITRRILTRKLASRPGTPDVEKRSPFKAPPREPGGKIQIPQPLRFFTSSLRR
jgi:hypothetical protein